MPPEHRLFLGVPKLLMIAPIKPSSGRNLKDDFPLGVEQMLSAGPGLIASRSIPSYPRLRAAPD
jgi:hypothetical protein